MLMQRPSLLVSRSKILFKLLAASIFCSCYPVENPTAHIQYYLEAVFHARNGNRISTEKAIRSAFKLGFSDKTRLLNQPEFKGMGIHAFIPY